MNPAYLDTKSCSDKVYENISPSTCEYLFDPAHHKPRRRVEWEGKGEGLPYPREIGERKFAHPKARWARSVQALIGAST